MKILLISDTHGDLEETQAIISKCPNMDAYIHLGDIGFPCKKLSEFSIIRGNHDKNLDLPKKHKFHFEGRHVMCIHGNIFDGETVHEVMHMGNMDARDIMDVFMQTLYKKLAAFARRKRCDTVFFGHTHHPCMEEVDGVVLINPGSVSLGTPYSSYAIVEIQDKKIDAVFYEIKCETNK